MVGTSVTKHSYRFRLLEATFGLILIVFTLFDRLPFTSYLSSSNTTISEPTTTIVDRSLVVPTIVEQAHESSLILGNVGLPVADVSKINEKVEGLMIHPWLPTLSASQIKPIIRESVLFLILQTVGIPLIGRFRTQLLVGMRCLIPLRRRLLGVVVSRKFMQSFQKMITSPKLLRLVQRNFRIMWKFLLTGYSKTSASKIVNRCKKYLHSILHKHDDHHHHHHTDDPAHLGEDGLTHGSNATDSVTTTVSR
jgi:hypothetical protein